MVQLTAPEEMTSAELLSACSVSAGHPLWKAVHHLLDEAQAAKITDALDPESMGEENAYRRGEANALAEFKARLLQIQSQALQGRDE